MVLLTLKGSNTALAFTYLTVQGDLRLSSFEIRASVFGIMQFFSPTVCKSLVIIRIATINIYRTIFSKYCSLTLLSFGSFHIYYATEMFASQQSAHESLSYTILLEEVLLLFFRHTSEAKNMADFDAIFMTTGPKSR